MQVKMTIPYDVPDSYSIRFVLTSAYFLQGTAYSSFESLTYTPVYTYNLGTSILVVSKMGPIVSGTTVTFTFEINVTTDTIFQIKAYIDTEAVITAFTASSYLY